MLQRIRCPEPNQHYFWYEAFICRDRKKEKVASGYLEQLTLELPEVKTTEQGDNIKLQLPENLRGSSWFTKSTLTSAPETSKICKSLRSEMAQLEEARHVHLQLYTQGHKEHLGSGKTDDHNSKVAERRIEGKSSMLVAADVYMPAAINQLVILGEQLMTGRCVPVYTAGTEVHPSEIVRRGLKEAKKKKMDVVIVDTVGRLQIDKSVMQELKEVKRALNPTEVLLVVEASSDQNRSLATVL